MQFAPWWNDLCLRRSCSCKFVVKQAIQTRTICEISLYFPRALCPSLFLSSPNFLSVSHVFFFTPACWPCPLFHLVRLWDSPRRCVCVCVCVCVWANKEETQREREREQWGVQHLNCLFISSHCINYTDTAYKWMHCVCVCVMGAV